MRAAAGEPLSVATVQVVDTGIGTLTGDDGSFSLNVPAGTYQLQVNRLGFTQATQTVRVEDGATVRVNFVLREDALELGELLVTLAADDARRAEVGTDIRVVDAQAVVELAPITDFSDLIRARVPGISVDEGSGEVGTASRIRIRGVTSLTQDNNPIVFIDGIRISNNTGGGPGSLDFGDGQTISRLDDLNPYDIARVQILKGPTAAATYGSEAAAGVMIIQTRRGQAGPPSFNFTTEQGISIDDTKYPDNYLNLTQLAGINDISDPRIQQWRPVQNPATGDIFARDNPLENPHTNPFRKGWSQSYNVSVSGGSPDVTYFASARLEDREGTLPNNDTEQYSFRGNFSARLSDQVDLSVVSSFMSSDVRYNGSGRSALGFLTNGGAGLPLFSYGTNPDGTRGDCMTTILQGEPEELCELREGNLTANFDKLATITNRQQAKRFLGSVIARIRPLAWWSNRVAVGIDYITAENLNFVPLDPDRPFGTESEGFRIENRPVTQITSFDYSGTTTYDATEDLRLRSTLGAQYFRTDRDMVGCQGRTFASNTAIACDAGLTFSGQSNFSEIVELGAYFQQQFDYRGFVFATGSIRVDQNSAFGDAQDAIWSPSVNVSAVLTSMPFWNLDLFNSFRVRAAWGKAAQAPEPFAADRTFRPVRVIEDGQQISGISLLAPGNAELTAERNEEFEVGVDASLLENRLLVTLTYYDQHTTDAILETRVAPSTGFPDPKFVNLGALSNGGVEGSIEYNAIDAQAVAWSIGANFFTQDPVITDLGGLEPILLGAQVDGMFHEGYAPGAYYGPVITRAQRDPAGDIIPESIEYAPGNLDVPGRPNYRYLGDPIPDLRGSIWTSFELFGNMQIYTRVDGAAGVQKMDDTQGTRTPFIRGVSGSRRFAFRQAESTPAEQAAMELNLEDAGQLFIDDADYLRWRELSLQYSVPPNILSAIGFAEALDLTVGVRNLGTLTGYHGLDPEGSVGGGSDNFTTGDFFNQPPSRYFFSRVSVSF